jgi:hypothetical protein
MLEKNLNLPPFTRETVWPPDPSNTSREVIADFNTSKLTGGGPVSDLRFGTVKVTKEGLTIEGRCAPRVEVQLWSMAAISILFSIGTFKIGIWALIFNILILPITHAMLEYGTSFRRDFVIPWDAMKEIKARNRLGWLTILFNDQNSKGMTRLFSLTFVLQASKRSQFLDVVRYHSPLAESPGKLHPWISAPAAVSLACMAALILLIVLALGSGYNNTG